MKRWFWLVFLTGCAGIDLSVAHHDLPITKQKQRVLVLQKKLSQAEKEQEKTTMRVEDLKTQLADAELTIIRREVDSWEEVASRPSAYLRAPEELFLREREKLKELIEEGTLSFEAQVLLDRILQDATLFSDDILR